jgi:hypothetical protein
MIRRSFALAMAAAASLSFVVGCAGNPLVVKKLEAGIDRSSYEEVLAYMAPQWGKPVSENESQERELLQVNFGVLNSRTVEKTVFHPRDGSSHATSETVKVSEIFDGESYMFTFDKNTRLLKWFQYRKFVDGYLTNSADGGGASFGPRNGETFLPKAEVKANLPATPSTLEQKLGVLKDLREKKAITGDEYERMREKLLNDFR